MTTELTQYNKLLTTIKACIRQAQIRAALSANSKMLMMYWDICRMIAQYVTNPRSYTKLDASGNDLPDTATSWIMVRDNITGAGER